MGPYTRVIAEGGGGGSQSYSGLRACSCSSSPHRRSRSAQDRLGDPGAPGSFRSRRAPHLSSPGERGRGASLRWRREDVGLAEGLSPPRWGAPAPPGDSSKTSRKGMRGGGDNADNVGYSVTSLPELVGRKAFVASGGTEEVPNTPEEARRKWWPSQKKAWFYPDPPWGRKNVFHAGSAFIMRWMLAVSAAMLYVAFIVPFRAAGFVTAERDTCSVYSAQFFQVGINQGTLVLIDEVSEVRSQYLQSRGFLLDIQGVRSQYLQSRGFLLDILGVLPLEGTLCLLEKRLHERKGEDMTKITLPKNLVKVVQVFRISKLLRLHNWNRMSRLLDGMVPDSRYFELAKLLGKMLLTGHVLACAWFWVGTMEASRGWMRMHLHVEEEHWVSKYVSSFYFIYATLTTVGYGDIAGLSTNERIFCIGIMVLAAQVLGGFLFGVLIGSLPTILDRRSEAGGRYARLEKSLTEYLVDKKGRIFQFFEYRYPERRSFHGHRIIQDPSPRISGGNAGRIFQFFEYRYPERRSFNGHRIIQDLPRSLRKELALHVHKTVVTACPLLTRCSPDTLGEICMLLRKVFCAEGDTIVSEGTPSTGIYFIKTGQ
ncbi:hypothetical protein T484DRAFT_1763534, partial [Baffinella frigidus]